MELSKEEAYGVFDLPVGAPFDDIVRQYKFRALDWYPDIHSYSKTSMENFQLLSQAFLVLYFADSPFNYSTPDRLLTLDEMVSLFQFVFFGNKESNMALDTEEYDDDEDDELYCDSDDDGIAYHDNDPEVDDKLSSCFQNSLTCRDVVKAVEAVQNAEELIQEEEREKKKSEKKKAQKKRRKERKRQEKAAQNTHTKKTPESEKESKKAEEYSSSEQEEEIDTTSAFVAGIAKKIPVSKNESCFKTRDELEGRNEDEHLSRTARSRHLATRANELANMGSFQEAVQLFTEAIRLDPKDFRFYGNRSYCLEKLNLYDRALKDAEKAILFNPKIPKGYFRKGKALSGLKRYSEAEECFETVLKMDPTCGDATKELLAVRMCQLKQLTEMGFTLEQAKQSLGKYGSVDAAVDALLSKAGAVGATAAAELGDVFVSDEDDEDDDLTSMFKQPVAAAQPSAAAAIDIKMDPTNPEGHRSLWIGNIQNDVTEKHITSLFCKYGELISIKLIPEKFCAFVNYKNIASAGKAMRALQGVEVCGGNLYIRFPNATPSKAPANASVPEPLGAPSTDECYFWRTTGCKYGSNCRFRHVRENKGIDKDKRR